MMRKVLCFHPALAPYRVDFFNALSERSDFHLILFNDNLLNQKFDQGELRSQLRCRVTYLLRGIQWRGRYLRLGVARQVFKDAPDVIIGCEYSPVTCYLILLRLVFRLRCQLFTTTDDNVELFEKCHGLRKVFRWFVLRHVDGVVVTTLLVEPMARKIARSRGLKVVDVPIIGEERRIRCGEDAVFAQAADWRTSNLQAEERAVFFVGRLAPVKNLCWLLSRTADSRWPQNAKLFVVGNGEQEAQLKAQCEELGLEERVVFCGRKEGSELRFLFAAADMLILPSVSETFGAVVAECLQWGGKVLVSSHVGAKILVEPGWNGDVFDGSDESEFHTKLACLLRECGSWRGSRPSLLKVTLGEKVDRLVEAFG